MSIAKHCNKGRRFAEFVKDGRCSTSQINCVQALRFLGIHYKLDKPQNGFRMPRSIDNSPGNFIEYVFMDRMEEKTSSRPTVSRKFNCMDTSNNLFQQCRAVVNDYPVPIVLSAQNGQDNAL